MRTTVNLDNDQQETNWKWKGHSGIRTRDTTITNSRPVNNSSV